MHRQPSASKPIHHPGASGSVAAYVCPIGVWASALKPIIVLAAWASERVIRLLIEWIKAKNGRKIRVKMGDVLIEATSPTEVDKIFNLLKKHEVLPNQSEDIRHRSRLQHKRWRGYTPAPLPSPIDP
jgi:hypothetical protein